MDGYLLRMGRRFAAVSEYMRILVRETDADYANLRRWRLRAASGGKGLLPQIADLGKSAIKTPARTVQPLTRCLSMNFS